MDRRALTLSLLLACGGSAAAPPAESGGSTTGSETEALDPELEKLVELAGDSDRREDALTRAQALRGELAEATEARREAVADAMGRALLGIEGTAGVDNRLRIELIRALGESDAEAARTPLTEIARRLRADQNFLINRLALETLAERREEANVPVLIEGLYLCDQANPALRMNDIAANGLAQLGEAAVGPLLDVLAGTQPRVSELVESYVELVEARVGAAGGPGAEEVRIAEALYGLGLIGHPGALRPLLEVTRHESGLLRLGAVMALVSLRPSLDDGEPIREALLRVYRSATELEQQAHLLVAARRLGDPDLAPFLLEVARQTDLDPSLRLAAAHGYALLTPAPDRAFGRLASGDRDLGPQLSELVPLVAEAERCSELSCWVQAFQEHATNPVDPPLAEKAAMQIGQLGRSDPRAISALVAQLGHRDIRVRLAALRALDRVAVHGSTAAVQRIAELRESEEGRAIWNSFAVEALPVQARLIARGR